MILLHKLFTPFKLILFAGLVNLLISMTCLSWDYIGPYIPSMHTFSWSAADTNVIYALQNTITDTCSIMLKSTNRGLSWRPAEGRIDRFTMHYPRNIFIHPLDPSMIWVTNTRAFFRTDDGGQTWSRTLTSLSQIPDGAMYVYPFDNRVLYVLMSDLRRSYDDGETWTVIYETGSDDFRFAMCPTDPHILIVVDGTDFNREGLDAIWNSNNGGASWESVDYSPRDLFDSLEVQRLWIYGNEPTNRMMIGVRTSEPYNTVCLFSLNSSRDWYVAWESDRRMESYHVDSENSLYLTLREGVFNSDIIVRSDDLGLSWDTVSTGTSDHVEPKHRSCSVVSNPLNPNTILVAEEAGLYRSQNRGQEFNLIAPHDLEQSSHQLWHDPQYVGRCHTIWKQWYMIKQDEQAEWIPIWPGVVSMAFNPDIADRVFLAGHALLTLDTEFMLPDTLLSEHYMYSDILVHPGDSTILFALAHGEDYDEAGHEAALLRSQDSGATWDTVLVANSDYMQRVCFAEDNPDQLFFIGETIWYSDNGGDEWHDAGVGEEYLYVDFVSAPDDCWFALVKEENAPLLLLNVYVSRDFGETWEIINNELGFEIITEIEWWPGEDPCLIAMCGDTTLYYTDDLGSSWNVKPTSLPERAGLSNLSFSPDGSTAFLCDPDRGFYRYDNFTTDIQEDAKWATPATFSLSPAWPNPFNSETRIEIMLPEAGELDVTLFNILGQKVATLERNRKCNAGIYTYAVDAASLAAGVYILRAEWQGCTRYQRITLLR